MYQRGLVTLSADPIHNGHIQLVKLAKQKCKQLFVLINNNDNKKDSYLFSHDERFKLAKAALSGMPEVSVIQSYSEVLSDIYISLNCDVLFRGIRNDKDQAYEEEQMSYHAMVYNKINPEYLSFRDKSAISSSIVKSFVSHYIDVSKYVPTCVKKALEEKISKQYKIAITGGIAVGKSWVADSLVKSCDFKISSIRRFRPDYTQPISPCYNNKFSVNVIKFDDLIRSIYDDSFPGAVEMKKEIDRVIHSYHPDNYTSVFDSQGIFNKKMLASVMFNEHTSPSLRLDIQKLTQPFVEMKYREALKIAGPGLVIIEWAQLGEMNVGDWTNYNVIVVDSPDRQLFLNNRGISEKQFKDINRVQWTAKEKIEALKTSASLNGGGGNIIEFMNSIHDNKIDALADAVMDILKLK